MPQEQDLTYRAKVYDDELRDLRANIKSVNDELGRTGQASRGTATARGELSQMARETRTLTQETRTATTAMGGLARSEDQVARSGRDAANATRQIGTSAQTAATQGTVAMGRLAQMVQSVKANAATLGAAFRGAGAGLAVSGLTQLLPSSGAGGALQNIASSTAAGAFAGSVVPGVGTAVGAAAGFATATLIEGIKSGGGNFDSLRVIQRNPNGSVLFSVKDGKGNLIYYEVARDGKTRQVADPYVVRPGGLGPSSADRGDYGQKRTPPSLIGSRSVPLGPTPEQELALQRALTRTPGDPSDETRVYRSIRATLERQLRNPEQPTEGRTDLLTRIGVIDQTLANLTKPAASTYGPTDAQNLALSRARALTPNDSSDDVRALRAIETELLRQSRQKGRPDEEVTAILDQYRSVRAEIDAILKPDKAKARSKGKARPDITELPGKVRLQIEEAVATRDDATDDLTAYREARRILRQRLAKATSDATRAVLQKAINAITDQVEGALKKIEQDKIDRLDTLQKGRDAGRALVDAREALAHARRTGDPAQIRDAQRDLEDAQLARQRLKLEGVTIGVPKPGGRPPGSARQLDEADPWLIARFGGTLAARMRFARGGTRELAVAAAQNPVEVHVYVDGRELATVVTPKVRSNIQKGVRRNSKVTRGRNAGRHLGGI